MWQMHHITQICEQQKNLERNSTNSLFTQKLNWLKKSQEIELKNFNAKWKAAIAAVEGKHSESMSTVIPLARNLQFDVVIKVRDAVETQSSDRRQQLSNEVNRCVEIQRAELLETHERGLDAQHLLRAPSNACSRFASPAC
jgi:hypothetical protein